MASQPVSGSDPHARLWEPTPAYIEGSHTARLMARHGIPDPAALQARARADIAWFWDAVVRDLGIHWYEPYNQVVDLSQGPEWARWFRGGRMNLAADCVDKHVPSPRQHKLAVVWEGEEGTVRRLTYRELCQAANRLAGALRELGIGKGDRVGIFMPLVPEVAVALLAVAKVGAIFVPIFSGFAPQAVADRLSDCGARLLLTADGFYRRGQTVPMKETADAALASAPTVEKVLVFHRTGQAVPWQEGRDVWWHEAVGRQAAVFATEPMDPEDPFMIIYTSGTTGRPKGAVHVHCGFPLKGTMDMAYCFDVREQDLMFWFTDIGWMMGPWLIFGTLTLGSTMLLYDGAPDYPGPDRLWSLVATHGVTHLGLSPTLVRGLMPHGDAPLQAHDLSTLRVLGGTGEPWNPEPFQWFLEKAGGGRCPLINYSGGTEISGGIVCGTTVLPVKSCGFGWAIPGMDADVVDETGAPVRGRVGELVIRQPWPGMTRGFWQDPERYLDAYWRRWPGVWVHGDWASIDADGCWFIQGRSDDTLKIAGKRLGPAEVESALVANPAVKEAAAIGVPHPVKGETVVAFVVLRPGSTPSEELRRALLDQVAQALGKALRPETVKFAADLPRTRNAKIMRRVVRAVHLNLPTGDTTALENPDALAAIRQAE